MMKLEGDEGKMVTDSKEILRLQANFYERLYESKSDKNRVDIRRYLDTVQTKSLSEEERDSLEGAISMEECSKAIKSFPKNKSPGNDGLTIEFYQKYWPIFGKFVHDSINHTLEQGELSASQKQAVITLLDKGKDRTKLKNWRPISLLNVDYKIMSKCLATRLKSKLSKLTHHNQAGYVQDRNILENIRAITDIIEYTKRTNKPGILLCIDFEKAFDSLEWNFMYEVLDKMNFGPSFIRWVKILYTNISSCVANNGHTSRYFPLQRGVRQGDPLSPYLFILAVEVLAQKIRENNKIKGIKIRENHEKLLQYADDTTGFIEDVSSAKEFLETVKEFGLYSGLRMNMEKTEAMWLGCNRESNSKPLGIKWEENGIKVTGVYFSYNEQACNELNFEQKLEKVKGLFNMWKMRNLTMLGRIQIVKTFVISQFAYVVGAINMPEQYIKELERIVWKFIWNGKREKLKRTVLCKPIIKGGLNAPNVRILLKSSGLKWIQRYVNGNEHTWKLFWEWYMEALGIQLPILLYSNFKLSKQDRVSIPVFYLQILDLWSEVGNAKANKENFLWYNQNIVIGGKWIYYESFHQIGIDRVKDLYDKNGKIIPFQYWVNKGLEHRDFLKWCGLINACKRDQVHDTEACTSGIELIMINGDKCISKVTTKNLYEWLQCRQNGEYVNIPRINNRVESTEVNWEHVYKRMHTMSVDTKAKEFQYKFLNDIIATNYWLHKWKITSTDMCTFCANESETIQHLFWECKWARELWYHIEVWYNDQTNIPANITRDLVFLGSDNILLHSIIVVGKQVIYSSKFAETKPNINRFKFTVTRLMKMELYNVETGISKQKCILEKWAPLQNM